MSTIAYVLTPCYSNNGDTVYRSIGVSDRDRRRKIDWYGMHANGRDATRKSWSIMHYEWRDSARKKIADFPSSGEPGGVFSAKAVDVLREILESSGDIYELDFIGGNVRYFLYDCWNSLVASFNSEFNLFKIASLTHIYMDDTSAMNDAVLISRLPGLLVSERFKSAVDHSGLVGFHFTKVEVIERE